MAQRRRVLILLLLSLLLASREGRSQEAPGAFERPARLVVESVGEPSAAHRAGWRAGDLLHGWRWSGAVPDGEPPGGSLDPPFDLDAVALERAARGPIEIRVERRGAELYLPWPGDYRPGVAEREHLRIGPRLMGGELAAYERSMAALDRGEIEASWPRLEHLAAQLSGGGRRLEAGWICLLLAESADEARLWSLADAGFRLAREYAAKGGSPGALARVLDGWGISNRRRSLFDQSAALHEEALELRRGAGASDLAVAQSLHNLGNVGWYRGDLEVASKFFQSALELRQRLAPESRELASSLNRLAGVVFYRGDLAGAEERFRRALELREKAHPGSLEVAMSLNNLGNVARMRGDLAGAEALLRRSIEIRRQLAAKGQKLAGVINNLGNVIADRGDLAAAEQHYRQAHEAMVEVAPDSLERAKYLNNLAILALERDQPAVAEQRFREVLELLERHVPGSLDVAMGLTNLGLAIFQGGELRRGEQPLRRALLLQTELAPGSLDTSATLFTLGDLMLAREELDAAMDFYHRSLEIRRRRAPGSASVAEACQRLGALQRRRGELGKALEFYDCAVDALESQKTRLGGSDQARAEFGDTVVETYRQAIDLLVELGREQRAFHLLERSRARELLVLLAARDLVFSADLPEDLERRRRIANQAYEQAYAEWQGLAEGAGDGERDLARQALDGARQRQDEIRAEVRTASPRLAALQDPEAMDLETATAILDPGTLLLSYSVGEEKTHLFVLGPDAELEVEVLDVGESALLMEVEAFRSAIARGRFDRRPKKVWLRAQRLSELLLRPAAARISRAERLLILADGVLHSLPFAALADPAQPAQRRYLAESKPLFMVPSATVFAHLKKARRAPGAVRLTAFGDPRYDAVEESSGAAEPALQAALRGGLRLAPLPASREEVEHLALLYPGARVFVGEEATESRAKAVGRETTHLHIAAHGLLDDRFPLDSAIALASRPPRRGGSDENGLLQAWEVFEQVRLDADLVTLSACDTGAGVILGGEGLVGLTRAFLYAGARTVSTSLWGVGDQSTGQLMKRFYFHLERGQSKVEALRQAQLDLIADARLSHPFHWAGFAMVGDWR